MPIRFEWDPRKERRNRQKHGIAFDEASTVFADTLSITIPDPDHSDDEERWVTIGLSPRVIHAGSYPQLWITTKCGRA